MKSSGKRKGNRIILITLAVILCGLVVIIGNADTYKKEIVKINTEAGELSGILVTSKDVKKDTGLIFFVHGDGPTDASSNGYYKTIWKMLTHQGYTVISWDKPGVNDSEGNWLNQTMEARANEVIAVIDWAKKQEWFTETKIGLWGGSQAGWVIPKVVGQRDIDFTILVSPAINWLRQGDYYTIQQLKNNLVVGEEMETALDRWEKELKFFKEESSYEGYLEKTLDDNPMEKDRWKFARANYLSDATGDLANFKTPVLLVLGGMDMNVDASETRDVYKKEIDSELLSIAWVEHGTHAMIKQQYVDSEIRAFFAWNFFQQRMFETKFLEEMKLFLESVNDDE